MPPFTLQRSVAVLRGKPGVLENSFLHLYLSCERFQQLIWHRVNQTAQPGIYLSELAAFDIPVPDPEEQRRIVEIMKSIASTIAHTSTLIAKLKQMKAGLLHDLLTRGLDENGKLRDAIAHPEQFKESPLGQIPTDWEVGSLATITVLQVGFAFKSGWFQENEGIRLLRGENVGYGSPDWSETRRLAWLMYPSYREYELHEGDIIIGMDRTFTKSGFKISILGASDIPALLVQRVGRFQPTNCDQRYLKVLLNSQQYHNALLAQQKGMDIPHLSQSEILEPLIPIPPIPEQRAIAARIDARIDAYDARIRAEETYLNKLKEQKKGLMHDLLTGRVRVTDLKEIPS